MEKVGFILGLSFLLAYLLVGCSQEIKYHGSNYDIPIFNHDLSYIPFDSKLDDSSFLVCDSTKIASGRNRLQYKGGTQKLKSEIVSKFQYRPEYNMFSGFVVVRFVVNCKGQSGRYRVEALKEDFTKTEAPSDLLLSSINLLKELDDWEKSTDYDITREYSKFINLRLRNGKIEHVLL